MALYDYECENCGWKGERILKSTDDRDKLECRECGHLLTREEIASTQVGYVDHRYQSGAILSNGAKIKGHFGVTAPNNKSKYR